MGVGTPRRRAHRENGLVKRSALNGMLNRDMRVVYFDRRGLGWGRMGWDVKFEKSAVSVISRRLPLALDFFVSEAQCQRGLRRL